MNVLRIVNRLVLVAVVGLSLAATARAEPRPHKWQGTGQFISANDYVAKGQATHLGQFREAGSVQFSPTGNPAVLQVVGRAIHTAANGDELHEVFTGWLNLQTGAASASVVFRGGTGRFANARGTGTLSARVLPDGSLEFAGIGTIDY